MSEVKVSQGGVEYIEPRVLKDKQRVYSQALLMKIPHDHREVSDIKLKIGRYNKHSGTVENEDPKSELTLDNEELNALIQYISENYTPVALGQGEYISIGENSGEIIRQFKALIDGNDNAASMLINNGILSDSVLVAATSIKRYKALRVFEASIDEDYPEKYWQIWFSDNKWVLGSDFAQIIHDRRIDIENIADYIMRAYDGFVDLVEIKKPNGMPFWAATKDHNNYVPSTDLIKALTQCLNYLHEIEEESDSYKFYQRIGSKVIKPRCILVYGRSNSWDDEQREAYRILNAAYSQLYIMTYDHLLARAKNVMGVEDCSEEDNYDDLPF